MKLLNFAIIGLGVFALTSCGVKDRHEEVKELNKKSKWNEDQTNQAIDIILEANDEIIKLNEDYFLIEEKLGLEYNIDRYGDEDVVKERKNEIKEAEKNLRKVIKEADKAHKLSSSSSDYDDYDYDVVEAAESDYDYDY